MVLNDGRNSQNLPNENPDVYSKHPEIDRSSDSLGLGTPVPPQGYEYENSLNGNKSLKIEHTIDRVKLTVPKSILTPGWKTNPHLKKLKSTDIGIYDVFINPEHGFFFKMIKSYSNSRNIHFTIKKFLDSRKKPSSFTDGNGILWTYSYSTPKPHSTYSVNINNRKNVSVTIQKKYVIIQINDILLKHPNKSLASILVNEILSKMYIFGVLKYSPRNENRPSESYVRQKCYRLLHEEDFNISEMELASNIPHFGNEIFFSLKDAQYDRWETHETSKYYNSKSWKSTLYNFTKSRDKSRKSLSVLNTPLDVLHRDNDIYRYEIRFFRDYIRQNIHPYHSDLNLLKMKPDILINVLYPHTRIPMVKFLSCLPFELKKKIIHSINPKTRITKKSLHSIFRKNFYYGG